MRGDDCFFVEVFPRKQHQRIVASQTTTFVRPARLGRPSCRGQSAVIAIRRSKAKRVQHMPRHNEAKKSGGDDCEDHEHDDLLHDADPHTPKILAATAVSQS
jgi:hypothetical protein